jgi:DNA excision repair protein ERCC-6-like 2
VPFLIESYYLGLDSNDEKISIPSFINRQLYPHQRDGVAFLFENFKVGKGCILGDDMGLGKSKISFLNLQIKLMLILLYIYTIELVLCFIVLLFLKFFISDFFKRERSQILTSFQAIQVIAFLSAIAKKRPDKPLYTSQNHKKFLIVTPASVLHQWQREVEKFGSKTFQVCIYHGVGKHLAPERIESGSADMLITSYGMFQKELDILNKIDWCCVVFDEIHKIKDRTTKLYHSCCELKCLRRYGLTGTVMQNHFEELWALLDWIRTIFNFL